MAKKRNGNRETESSPLVEQEPRPSRETPVLKGTLILTLCPDISLTQVLCSFPRLVGVGIIDESFLRKLKKTKQYNGLQ